MQLQYDRGPIILQVGINTAWWPLEKWTIPTTWTCCAKEDVYLLKHPDLIKTCAIGVQRYPDNYSDGKGQTTLLALNRPNFVRSFQVNLGIDDKHLKTLDFAPCFEVRFVATPEGFVIYYRPSQEILQVLPQATIDGLLATMERVQIALQSAQNALRGDLETIVRPSHADSTEG